MHERDPWYNYDEKILLTANRCAVQHMQTRGVENFIAGKEVTHSSCNGEGVTNQK